MGSGMDLDTLVEHWTLLDDELDLVMTKHGATKLGFALLLKFFTHWGRFPASRSELSDEVVAFVARQVRTDVPDLDRYEWDGRTIERHRGQIRDLLGFRECGVADADKLTAWLAEQVALVERRPEQVRERDSWSIAVRSASSRQRLPGSSESWPRPCTRRRRRCSPEWPGVCPMRSCPV